jgi:hypothetical protein
MWILPPKLKKEDGDSLDQHFQKVLFQGKRKKRKPTADFYEIIEQKLECSFFESIELELVENSLVKKKHTHFFFDGVELNIKKTKKRTYENWDFFSKSIREKCNLQIRKAKQVTWATPRTGMAIAHKGGGDPFKKEWFFRLENQLRYHQNWATPTVVLSNNIKRSLESLVKKAISGDRKFRSAPCNSNEQIDPLSVFVYEKVCEFHRLEDQKGLNVLEYVALETKLFKKNKHPFNRQGLINPRWVESLMGLPLGFCKV